MGQDSRERTQVPEHARETAVPTAFPCPSLGLNERLQTTQKVATAAQNRVGRSRSLRIRQPLAD